MKLRFANVAAIALMCLGGYAALYIAPTERLQGDIQRIFYFHLPSWIAMFVAFFIAAIGNIGYLATRKHKWDWLSVSAVEVGVICCTIGLITGPLWGKPVWGIWWTWDARLTSTAMLWLLYVSYLMLRKMVEEPDTRARLSAIFGLFAFLDIPLVYTSNRIFRTQHPPPVIGGGPDSGLDPTMAKVLLLCTVAFVCVAMMSLVKRYRMAQLSAEVDELRVKIEDRIEIRAANLRPSLEKKSP
jgi:heme exporter protein C